jgi:hypothetical protein
MPRPRPRRRALQYASAVDTLAAIATPDAGLVVILIVVAGDQTGAVGVSISIEPDRFS